MENIYQVDVPIDNIDNDLLNRSKFVEILSESIIHYNNDECLVIGLMGEWGCGKTSIINLVDNNLKKFNKKKSKDEKEFRLIKFNPWYFSNRNTIIIHFFDILKEGCKDENVSVEIFDCISRLKDKLCNEISITYDGGSFNIHYFNHDHDLVMQDSFISIKNRLIELFYDLNFKIVVSIDDIDRLADNEIQQIFSLVKILADFPNIIYILSFDKNVALRALNNLQVYSPEKFLEKIIQIPILVPEITKTRLDLVVKDQLEPIFEESNKVEEDKFSKIFSIIRPFFTNIRDLKRYMNLLKFYLNQFLDEINVGDFFIMIAIQLFEEEIYLKIKENKSLLIYDDNFEEENSEIKSKIYNRLLEELNSPKKYDSDKFDTLLSYLFPILKDYNSEYKEYSKSILGTNLNISSKLHFDKYFTWAIEENEISQIVIDELLTLEDVDEISNIFLKLINENKTISLLNKLQTNLYKLDSEDTGYFIEALFLIGDNIKYISKLYETIDMLFNHQYDGNKSYNIFKNMIIKSKSFYTCCYCLNKIGIDYNLYFGDESKSKNLPYIEPDQFKELKTKAYHKLIKWAKNGKLVNNVHFLYFLDFWKIFGTKDEVNDFIKANYSNFDYVKIIDNARVDNEIIVDDDDKFEEWEKFDFNRLFEYFYPDDLERMVEFTISNKDISKDDEELCKLFLDEYKRNSV